LLSVNSPFTHQQKKEIDQVISKQQNQKAAKPGVAIPIYQNFVDRLSIAIGKKVQTGVFGADMKVTLLNDGPVTLIIDSKDKS